MSRDSLAAAKVELKALVEAASPTTPVYGFEPNSGQALKPVAVSISTAGMTPTEYLIGLRIYVSAESSVERAQTTLDALITALDAGMNARFGPSSWTVEWHDELVAYVATNVFEVGREDHAFR